MIASTAVRATWVVTGSPARGGEAPFATLLLIAVPAWLSPDEEYIPFLLETAPWMDPGETIVPSSVSLRILETDTREAVRNVSFLLLSGLEIGDTTVRFALGSPLQHAAGDCIYDIWCLWLSTDGVRRETRLTPIRCRAVDTAPVLLPPGQNGLFGLWL